MHTYPAPRSSVVDVNPSGLGSPVEAVKNAAIRWSIFTGQIKTKTPAMFGTVRSGLAIQWNNHVAIVYDVQS